MTRLSAGRTRCPAVEVLLCPDSKGLEGSGYPLPAVWGWLLYIIALALWVGRRKALLRDQHLRQEQVVAQPFSATPSKKSSAPKLLLFFCLTV